MHCPYCDAANGDEAENCFHCGKGLFTLTEGALLHERYAILKPLGKGGMGMVYKAHDRELDEVVAVKLLRADLALSPEVARRFRSEIKLARRVRHRNVCAIHEYGQQGHLKYILMEYVEGEDLKQVVRRRGGLPAEEAFDISLQAASGLQAIHEAGIVHRDLKTPNMMLDPHGVVRLMDFGIAKQFDTDASGPTGTGHVVGTPEYMSPEQARAERIDSRSDLYALGVVIYELFTGCVPFRGDTPVATMLKHIAEPPLQAPEAQALPPALRDVLARLLAKNKDERFASAHEVIEALREARQATLAAAPLRLPAVPVVAGALAQRTDVLPTPVPTPVPAPTPLPADPTRVLPAPAAPTVTQRVPPAPPRQAAPRAAISARRVAPAARAGPWGALARWTVPGAAVVGLVMIALWLGSRPRTAPVTVASPPDPPASAAQPAVVVAPRVEAPRQPDTVASASAAPAPRRSAADAGATAAPTRTGSSPRPEPTVSRPPSPAAVVRPVESTPPPMAAAPSPPPSAREPAVETGLLRVVVRPYAEVSVDGRVVGTSPPLAPVTLPAGVHAVVLSHPDYRPLPKKVTVRAGETTRLEVDLAQEAFRK